MQNCSAAGIGLAMTSRYWSGQLFAQSADKKAGETNYFGLTKEEIEKILETALSKGGDFADLFFEHRISNSVTLSEDIIKNSSQNIMLGVGIRVMNGEQTGYAYTNIMTPEKIKEAALVAASASSGNSKIKSVNLNAVMPEKNYYELNNLVTDSSLAKKIELIRSGYDAAMKYDSRIVKASATLTDYVQNVTIANSEGLIISDVRPDTRLLITSNSESNGKRGSALGNDGGRYGIDYYAGNASPAEIGKAASEEAIILLDAENAPAGEYPVVLSKHKSGVMIHEACGHPLEGDANWKGQSVMCGKFGTMIASPLVTIYDDATIPGYRGSLSIDDEGCNTESVMLVDKGKFVGYMHDRLSAKMLKFKQNGHGRRENYQFMPIPRMNNTILAKGESDPEEIIKSVKHGFYAKTYQGGMVENTGKFTFSVNLGYLIEDGKLTRPLRNATLIGSNIAILKDVDMVANDTAFFLGTCGKAGQSVAVTAGTPTLRIKKMTVGGI